MTTAVTNPTMTGQEIVDLTKRHTLFEWSAQSKVDPIPVARAKGIYFWTPEDKRYIDTAVEAAKRRARAEELAQVKVHKHDGNMEYESTYGADPPRSPG